VEAAKDSYVDVGGIGERRKEKREKRN